ncbi:MAG: GAF domain-containing protein [Bacteroidota bacterium]
MKNKIVRSALDEIKAISFFSSSLHTKESVDDVLWDITKNVIQNLGFVDCVIYEYQPQQHVLVQRAAFGAKNPTGTQIYNRIAIHLGEGIVGDVAQKGKAECIGDTSNDPRYIVDDEKRLSELCVPIIIDGELFGIIDSEHPNKYFFTERHLHLVKIIAVLCAQKIKEIRKKSKRSFSKANQYFKKLDTLMRFKKMYRDPYLSLSSTAEAIGISACYLSSMMNTLLNKSFIDFVNEYRVDDVKHHLNSQAFANYTIVSVGLEAGFNSKSAFYTAFKKHTGLTPLQYKNSYRLVS